MLGKILTLIFIFGLTYLLYLMLFTNDPIMCETMINLSNDARNINQYFTYTDDNKVEYVLIRLSDIKNNDGNTDRPLISELYKLISQSVEDYDKLTKQNSKQTIQYLKTGPTQIIREPLLAIKAVDAVALTKNNIISGSLKDISIDGNTRTVLMPYSSQIEGNKINGNRIDNRTIYLDTILFLDQDNNKPISITNIEKLYLHKIHEITRSGNTIDIFILKNTGNNSSQIKLY